jgi:hypothetical protein
MLERAEVVALATSNNTGGDSFACMRSLAYGGSGDSAFKYWYSGLLAYLLAFSAVAWFDTMYSLRVAAQLQ